MKSRLILPAALAACLVTVCVFSTVLAAQEPQGQQGPPAGMQAGPGGPGGAPRTPPPPPTNLKVLPKDTSGQQVRDIMRKWESDLGAECEDCHTPDPVKKQPNGRPMMNNADDSKPNKEIARIMYTMTESLKAEQLKKAAALNVAADAPKPAEFSCGTCHRGKLNPEVFVAPKRQQGPGGPGGPGAPGAPGGPGMAPGGPGGPPAGPGGPGL